MRLRYLFKFLNVSLIQSVIKIKKKKVVFFFPSKNDPTVVFFLQVLS